MNDYRWNDLATGMAAQFEVELSAEMMSGFATISGDVNPLHADEEFAKAAGFPSRVAFGLLTTSFYSRLVGVYLPGKRALLHGIDVEFRLPAYIGDRLSVSGEVVFLNEAYRRLELKARIRNQAGNVISKAAILAGVREP